jgi:hypothetical protein
MPIKRSDPDLRLHTGNVVYVVNVPMQTMAQYRLINVHSLESATL